MSFFQQEVGRYGLCSLRHKILGGGAAELPPSEAGGGGVGLQPGMRVGSGESKRDMPVPWGWDMVDGVP